MEKQKALKTQHIQMVAEILGVRIDIGNKKMAEMLALKFSLKAANSIKLMEFFHSWAKSPKQNLLIALERATNNQPVAIPELKVKQVPKAITRQAEEKPLTARQQKIEKKREKKQAKKQAIKAINAYRNLKSQTKNQRLAAQMKKATPVVNKPQPKARFHAPKVSLSFDYNFIKSNDFLLTDEWRNLRNSVVSHYGTRCMCCKRDPTPGNGLLVNVDHIKPRKTHPQLALTFDNLQVLCNKCNKGKGNWDTTDWRPKKM